jgi:hypothetical protein
VAQAFPLTGRGYFVDHFKCVPDLSSILVIKTVDNGRIVSTMRLFEHKIVLGVRNCRQTPYVGSVS